MKETIWIWSCVATLAVAGCAAGTTDATDPGGSGDDGGPVTTPIDAGELDAGNGNAMPPPLSQDSGGTVPSSPDAGAPVINDDAGAPSAPDAGSGGGGSDAGSTPDTGGGGPGPIPDSGSGGGTGKPPTSCAAANGSIGCCLNNVLYYCAATSTSLTQKSCTSGQVCGWSPGKSYYACVSPPATSDPSGANPLACP